MNGIVRREALGSLLDAIVERGEGDRGALRHELARHLDGDSWCSAARGRGSLRLYESAASLRRRMQDLRDALGAEQPVARADVTARVQELRAHLDSHQALERALR